MRNSKQKIKDNRIQRNAHRMKNLGGIRLIQREDRLKEVARRKEVESGENN